MRFGHCVIDGFLGERDADALLAFAIANEAHFEPSGIVKDDGREVIDKNARQSSFFVGDCSALMAPFTAAVEAQLDTILKRTGTRPFEHEVMELGLVAYRDGGLFTRHIDALRYRDGDGSVRMVSIVYYLQREPRRFFGGELALYPLVGEDADTIEPVHDRLVAFTTVTPHEVKRVSVPGDRFEDARFAIVCWLKRARR
ncbi:MAG: 2OG-Fe(II) oxygenase [Pseudomonadota bacterium]